LRTVECYPLVMLCSRFRSLSACTLLMAWVCAGCTGPICIPPAPDEIDCTLTPLSNPCPVDPVPPEALDGDCTRLDDGAPCGLPCYDESECIDGQCVPIVETEMSCSQSEDPCVASISCDPTTGECTLIVRKLVGDVCNADANVCTLEECDENEDCVTTGVVLTCEEERAQDVCFAWHCDEGLGCLNTGFDEGALCDDDDPCTDPDTCLVGLGCVGVPLPTDDGDVCTVDTCVDGAILHDALVCLQPDDVCEGINACDPVGSEAVCAIHPSTVVVCGVPTEECREQTCLADTGECLEVVSDDGTFCCQGVIVTNEMVCPNGVTEGTCINGICEEECTCDGIECGMNSCGDICLCPAGLVCDKGVCKEICFPKCLQSDGTLNVCGDDGCGGTCGDCEGCSGPDESLCTAEGQCATVCCPDCEGKVCGGDGCGGTCGQCLGCDGVDNSLCNVDGTCAETPANCNELTVCAAQCKGNTACATICYEQSCTAAQQAFSLWGGCITTECGATPSAACMKVATSGVCESYMGGCLQAPTPLSECFGILACQAGCATSLCSQGCNAMAPLSAQQKYSVWQSCVLATCGPGVDTACWEEADAGVCGDHLDACKAP
jgi:hypothetical protein